MMTPEPVSPATVPTLSEEAGQPIAQSNAQLRKRLEAAFTAETPATARLRIIDAIVMVLNEPEDD